MNLDQFTGHTAGPWNTLQYGPVNVLAGRRMVATTGCYSSNVDTESVDAENEANARLIAAAPDLLEYAKRLESENKRLREAAGPIAEFITKFDAKPLRQTDDEFYGIHMGSEWEASIRFSHFRALKQALESTP